MNLKRWLILLFVSVLSWSIYAESPTDKLDPDKTPPLRVKIFEGKYHTIDPETGDTVLVLVFNEIKVYPELRFKNKKDEEYYWRTVRNVKRTLPYAKLIAETIVETYEYIESLPTEKERNQHLKQMEKEVFNQYKPVFKKFTKEQAKVLIKLVKRETDQSSYQILKAFLGPLRATFWQGFGKLFGVNLRSDFQPEKNKDDAMIDLIATKVEQGQL